MGSSHLKNKIVSLKRYFQNRPNISMVFLFGSQVKRRAGRISDWDIAVYFKPLDNQIEFEETGRDYPQENKIWLKTFLK